MNDIEKIDKLTKSLANMVAISSEYDVWPALEEAIEEANILLEEVQEK